MLRALDDVEPLLRDAAARRLTPTGDPYSKPASRYSTSEPATATLRLAPRPTIGIRRPVEQVENIGCDSVTLVSEDDNGPPTGGGQIGEPRGTLDEFDADDPTAFESLVLDPAGRIPGAMDTRSTGDSVAATQCVGHPVVRRYRHGGADGVAGPQECSEVGTVLRPERRDDEMAPTGVASTTTVSADLVRRADAHPAHQSL